MMIHNSKDGTVLKSLGTISLALLCVMSLPGTCRADTVFLGPVEMNGTGSGTVNANMTMRELGRQMGLVGSGCVGASDSGGLNATMQSLEQQSQTDADQCEGGNIGSLEKPLSNFSHNQALLVSDASEIGVTFNSRQLSEGSVRLSEQLLAPLNANGRVGFKSGATSQDFSSEESEPGIGNSGSVFALDASQMVAIQAAINPGRDRLGVSATDDNGKDGPETFTMKDKKPKKPKDPKDPNDPNDPTTASEPGSLALLVMGAVLVSLGRRRMTAN